MGKNYRFAHVLTAAMILAAALITSAYLLSRFLVKLEKDKMLCVKGYAEKTVKSDVGYFTFGITAKSKTSTKYAYFILNKSMETAVKMLKELGFKDDEISKANMYSSAVFKIVNGKATNEVLYYQITQTAKVKSKNVDLVNKKHKNLNSLLAQGINIDIADPSYFISDLNKYKIELLEQATKNARLRAQTIAKCSGSTIGKVVWAQQGVIQITAPLSTETSSYGVYNTDSMNKSIKIVVTLKYIVGK